MDKSKGKDVLQKLQDKGLLTDKTAIKSIDKKIEKHLDDRIEVSKSELSKFFEGIKDFSGLEVALNINL